MAKKKKSPAKPAKKVKKAKTVAKSRKAVPARAKKTVKKKSKPAPKKVKARKVTPKASKAASKAKSTPKAAPKATPKGAPKATSKVAPKAAAPKPSQKKPVEKVARVTKRVVAKKATSAPRKLPQPVVETNNPQANSAAKIAATAQLNFFQMPNQRPMAHKPTKPSSTAQDNKTRYTEEELQEFQVLINRKLEKAREEYKILKETLNRNNDEGTDATSGGNTKVLEDGAETAEKENLSQLAARQQKYITNLENALVRIKNGTYGICSVTGKLISKERLIAVPHTTQSIEAKLMQQD